MKCGSQRFAGVETLWRHEMTRSPLRGTAWRLLQQERAGYHPQAVASSLMGANQ